MPQFGHTLGVAVRSTDGAPSAIGTVNVRVGGVVIVVDRDFAVSEALYRGRSGGFPIT